MDDQNQPTVLSGQPGTVSGTFCGFFSVVVLVLSSGGGLGTQFRDRKIDVFSGGD